MIPKRRKRERMNVRESERIDCPPHRAWVRGLHCSAAGKHLLGFCGGRMQAAHVQDDDRVPWEERGGTGIKPWDNWVYPLCERHHRISHNIGHDRFDRECGIDRVKIAIACWKASPARIRYERKTMVTA